MLRTAREGSHRVAVRAARSREAARVPPDRAWETQRLGDDEPAALRGILERSAAETRELGHGYIGSEDLLPALFGAAGIRAAQRLEAAGGRYDDVRALIVTIVGVSADEIAVQQILPYTRPAVAVVRRVREAAERGRASDQLGRARPDDE
jgi:hypothetical protein